MGNRLPNQIVNVGIIKFNLGHGLSRCFCVWFLLWLELGSPNEPNKGINYQTDHLI
jgi:hypothetical protein